MVEQSLAALILKTNVKTEDKKDKTHFLVTMFLILLTALTYELSQKHKGRINNI